jgi:hypothetical protein
MGAFNCCVTLACHGGVVSSATEETGAMGREIEYHKGIVGSFLKNIKQT